MASKELSTPAVAIAVVVGILILGVIGWRYLNPPELKPVGAQGATMAPMEVPSNPNDKSGTAKPTEPM